MERIRTGVIGVGRMGKHHCRVHSGLKESHLVGIFDINKQTAKEISEIYEVPSYDRLDDLLNDVDAVSIATPTPTHYELIKRCIDHKIHVLVEKPITDCSENALKLIDLVDGINLIIMVGHIERFNPTYTELKNVLETQKVLAINFRRLSPYRVSNKDVDVVMDLMVHDLDLCLDLTGAEPTSINAYGIKPFSDGLDHVVAQLFYSDGPLITLTASRVTEGKIRMVEVTTEEAFIEADFLNKNIYVHRCSSGEYSSNRNNGVKYQQESMIQRILVPNAEPLALEIKHFITCIINKTSPDVPIHTGARALLLVEQIRNQVEMENSKFSIHTKKASA